MELELQITPDMHRVIEGSKADLSCVWVFSI